VCLLIQGVASVATPLPVVAHSVVRGEIVAAVMATGMLETRVKTTSLALGQASLRLHQFSRLALAHTAFRHSEFLLLPASLHFSVSLFFPPLSPLPLNMYPSRSWRLCARSSSSTGSSSGKGMVGPKNDLNPC